MALAIVAAGACGEPRSRDELPPARAGGARIDAPERAAAGTPPRAVIATAVVPLVEVFDDPSASRAAQRLAHPTESGAPLVFLVEREADGWVHVHLPVRPNGSKGWIEADAVRLDATDYRVVIELGAHRITVSRGDEVVLQEAVGVGTRATPTPGGDFFIKELLRPPDPDGPYGPYAYGLSGFSNVLTEFEGGPGVVGIHGTNDPASLGTDVSHGCIRMSNAGITRLVGVLPLGTPVEILP